MNPDNEKIIEIIQAGKYLFNRNLAWAGTGNISQLTDNGTYFVTASGSRLGFLNERTIAECRLSDNESIGSIKPSKEAVVHKSIYMNNRAVKAIVHTSPLYSTMICASEFGVELELAYFIESMVMLRNLSWVDFYNPGSEELATAVGEASTNSDIIMLRNHGVFATGETIVKALNKIDTLEFLCNMLIVAKGNGIKLEPLAKDKVARFFKESSYKSLTYGN